MKSRAAQRIELCPLLTKLPARNAQPDYNLQMRAFRTVAWVIGSIYASVPLFWLAVHPFVARWKARRGKIYPLLGLIWLTAIVLLLEISLPYRSQLFYNGLLQLIGWAVFLLLGLSVYRRLDGFGFDRLIGRNELQPAEHPPVLITSGMHGQVRHPFYLGHLLMLTAWTIGSGMIVLIGMWVFAILSGALMIRLEERELIARFGDAYRLYRKRTPLLIPHVERGQH